MHEQSAADLQTVAKYDLINRNYDISTNFDTGQDLWLHSNVVNWS